MRTLSVRHKKPLGNCLLVYLRQLLFFQCDVNPYKSVWRFSGCGLGQALDTATEPPELNVSSEDNTLVKTHRSGQRGFCRMHFHTVQILLAGDQVIGKNKTSHKILTQKRNEKRRESHFCWPRRIFLPAHQGTLLSAKFKLTEFYFSGQFDDSETALGEKRRRSHMPWSFSLFSVWLNSPRTKTYSGVIWSRSETGCPLLAGTAQ